VNQVLQTNLRKLRPKTNFRKQKWWREARTWCL